MTSTSRLKSIMVIGLCCLLFVNFGCKTSESKKPLAKKGVIDLSHWDFKNDGKIDLNGEWGFYWQQLHEPLSTELGSKEAYFKVPGKWNGYEYDGKKLTGQGFATFQLKVKVPSTGEILALKVMDMGTSYRLWVDGELLLTNGTVGKNKNAAQPLYLPQTASFLPKSDTVHIILQVANFSHRKGGVWKPIELGWGSQINQERERNLSFELFLFGSLLIMGVYHFGLFILRRKDKSSLYFGIVCLLTALRVILTGERFLISLYPDFNWEITQKLEYLTFYLGVPLFPLFLRTLFPEFNQKIVNSVFSVGVVFSLFTLVTPMSISSYGMVYYQVVAAAYCLYALYALIRAAINKQNSVVWVFIGVVVLVLTVFHDLLIVNEIIHSIALVPFGLFFFIFIQSIMLSLRFSKAFSTMEIMSEQLGIYANQMEELVEERTIELSQSNEELKKTNKKISDSIEYASIIQNSILPDTDIIKQHMPNSFFIWKPRDVVGGDYFMLEPVKDGVMLATIDCTGHGIPGALMTMLASSGLRRIIIEEKCTDPAMILKKLNFIVKTTLQQDKETTESDNGLDGSICYLNTKLNHLVFAGAHQPLVYIMDSEMHLIKGDRQSVGYKNSELDFDFTNHTIELKNEGAFYLYTDGITDQSVGDQKFSLGKKRFKAILQAVHNKDFERQKELIIEEFNRLRGQNEVRDDITIVGFKPHYRTS